MRFKLQPLVVLACLTALSACSTVPQASGLPVPLECPRPGRELLQPVPPLPPLQTKPALHARAPHSLPNLPPNGWPPTPTWPSGSPPPGSNTKPAAPA